MPKLQPFRDGYGPGSDDGTCQYYVNGKYQVMIRKTVDEESVTHLMLSVRREDRKPIMDWRDLQWIKNEILGPEEEMLQIFPAESRLVDTSNQYWFFHYPGKRWPFGFQTRLVTQSLKLKVSDHEFSEQRPFSDEHRPTDLAEQEEGAKRMFIDIGIKPVGKPQ